MTTKRGQWGRVQLDVLNGLAESPRAVQLYAVLTCYADDDGRCWPSRDLLARSLDCREETIGRTIALLEAAGVLRVEGPQRNQYVLRIGGGKACG